MLTYLCSSPFSPVMYLLQRFLFICIQLSHGLLFHNPISPSRVHSVHTARGMEAGVLLYDLINRELHLIPSSVSLLPRPLSNQYITLVPTKTSALWSISPLIWFLDIILANTHIKKHCVEVITRLDNTNKGNTYWLLMRTSWKIWITKQIIFPNSSCVHVLESVNIVPWSHFCKKNISNDQLNLVKYFLVFLGSKGRGKKWGKIVR